VARLRALKISDDGLSTIVVGLLAQRLLARLCAECRAPQPTSEHLLANYLGGQETGELMGPVGCAACDQTGYNGLLSVFELVEATPSLLRAIGEGASLEELHERVEAGGHFRSMLTSALDYVRAGETCLSEVARRLAPPRASWGTLA